MYFVLTNNDVGGIIQTRATAKIRTVEAHLKPFDPDPIAPIHRESPIELRQLPGIIDRILLNANIESPGSRVIIPAFLHRNIIMAYSFHHPVEIIVLIKALLITSQIFYRPIDFCEPDVRLRQLPNFRRQGLRAIQNRAAPLSLDLNPIPSST